MKLTTKLSVIVGVISTVIAIISSYAVIRIVFQLTENQIKNSLITKHKQVGLLASPSKSTELATFLRNNDLSLLIFDINKKVVARYGIYRDLDASVLTNLMTSKGYGDKNIDSYGRYDVYTEDNIQIAVKNDFLPTLVSAFGLTLLIVSPIILLFSLISAIFVVKIVLSPLTKAESISHELKTPLARAVSSLQVIAEDSPQKFKESLKAVTSDLIQLGGNVDTLLTLSLYKKRTQREHGESDVAKEFAKVKHIIPLDLNFDYKISRKLIIPVSSNFTNIVLRNLLDNAVKYNRPGGYVNFTAQRLNGGWGIEVENSKKLERSKIGYGLGMTIVKEICHFLKLNLEQEETEDLYKIRIIG